MQLIEVPAKTGYVWFRQGIWLFRRSPLAFLALFITYLLAMSLISAVPFVGGVLPMLLVPGAAVGFMAACRDTVAAKPFFPTIIADGFRSYGAAVTKQLFILGGIYLAAMLLVLVASSAVDGGTLLQLMTVGSSISVDAFFNSNAPYALMTSLLLYLPVSMLFWFAPVLSAWHGVPPVKAMFFSVISVWRNKGAFAVYGLLWLGLSVGLSMTLSLVMQAFGAQAYAELVLMPVLVIVMTMMYCSFYATYRGCFGVQERQPAAPTASSGR